MSDVLDRLNEHAESMGWERVPAHAIERDYADNHSEVFKFVDRRPYEQVRMTHDRAMQANKVFAEAPYIGETPQQYDRRLVKALAKHSPSYEKFSTFQKIPDSLYFDGKDEYGKPMPGIRTTVMREALEGPARRNELVEIKLQGPHGTGYSEYEGSMAWLDTYKAGGFVSPVCVNGVPHTLPVA
ncbi:hypothetical protein [Paraburkholderia sp. C35]|uniref:hypothetical protein n=1 Tax=Paraburkholderia sp. C35 TaxID=2126993 RepID=UPI000D6893B0|nr:hypothetical protein [Paraburkholderia sp. C35]